MNGPLSRMSEWDVAPRGLRQRVCGWGATDDRPAVVCCHGWLDQGAAWDAVACALVDRGYRVIAPDHRGHGHSAWTPPGTTYHFMEYVADVDALIETLELDRPILVGHSMGGTIASLYAGLRPQRVAGLVLLDGLGPPAVAAAEAVEQAATFLDHQRRSWSPRRVDSTADAAERIRRTNPALAPDRALALAERATRATADGRTWRWDPMHRTRAAVAYDATRHQAILRQIRCPVAVGVGSAGWYGQLPDLDARVAAIARVVAREAIPVGHDLHHAAVERVVSMVDTVRTGGSD